MTYHFLRAFYARIGQNYHYTEGTIEYAGQDLLSLAPDQRAFSHGVCCSIKGS